VTAELIERGQVEGEENSRTEPQSLMLGALALLFTTMVLARLALSRGQDWSFDSHSYHNVYAYATVFERDRLGYPMALGAYFNPLLDLPLGWGVRHLDPRIVTVSIVCVQAIAIAGAAALPWHAVTGRVLPRPSGRWQLGRTELMWCATYGFSAVIAYGAFSRIQLGATWGDLTSIVPVVVGLHLLVSWTRTVRAKLLFGAGALFGVACGLKYTNGSNLMGGVMFVTAVAAYRSGSNRPMLDSLRDVRRFVFGSVAGAGISLGPWFLVQLYRFGNPLFPFGGRRLNDELITPAGHYVDLGASSFTIRSAREFFGDPIRLLRHTTAISEFPVRDPRLFISVCCCIALLALGLRARRIEIHRVQEPSLHGLASALCIGVGFAVYWAVTYTSWALLFGNGRYLEVLELLTPTLLCIAVVAIATTRDSERGVDGRGVDGRGVFASVCVMGCVAFATVPLTSSPDYGHVAFGRRWYDFDTGKLPSLSDSMVIVPYEFEPLDFGEFVLAPRSYARLHAVLLPTRLGQREVERIKSFNGPLYSFQLTNAGDANLAAVGLHRSGLCYPVTTSQGFSYNLCELERNR
jgi:hypothetical protein